MNARHLLVITALCGSLLGLPVLFVLLMYRLNELPANIAAWRYESADSLMSAALTPSELQSETWSAVPLRDWGRPLANRDIHAWYRIEFAAASAGSEPWGVFVDQTYSHLHLFVNDVAAGDGGPDTGYVPVLRNPLWIRLPARVLHSAAGGNDRTTLLIRSDSGVGHTTLDHVFIGPAAALRPAFDQSYNMKRWLRDSSLAVVIAATSIFGLLAFLLRRDTYYAWAAATLLGWSIAMWQRQFSFPPLHPAFWDALGHVSLGWFVLASTVFVHRIVNQRFERFERVIIGWGAIGTLLLLAAAPFGLTFIFSVTAWLPSLLALGIYILIKLAARIVAAAEHRQYLVELVSFWFSACVVFGTAAHDYVTYFLGVAPGTLQFLTYSGFVLAAGMTVVVLRRFVMALAASETLNRELEQRVAQKADELERNLVRVKDLEREHALIVQRERITRDVHDGLGGQLVAALSLVNGKSGTQLLEETLQLCLQELRLIIDSSEPVHGDLPSVLGMLRLRSEKRLSAAGIVFDWQVNDLPRLPNFEPHQVLQVMRIVQEALTNVLKHAQASRVSLSTTIETRGSSAFVRLDISDNGRGLTDQPSQGRGLSNMRQRAADIGGEVQLRSRDDGCTVTLFLPLADSAKIAAAPG